MLSEVAKSKCRKLKKLEGDSTVKREKSESRQLEKTGTSDKEDRTGRTTTAAAVDDAPFSFTFLFTVVVVVMLSGALELTEKPCEAD